LQGKKVEESTLGRASADLVKTETACDPQSEPSAPENGEAPLRSQYTNSFPPILEQQGISLAVTTYQTGHLVLFRCQGTAVNTHFRCFGRPMGLAYDMGQLAIGTRLEIDVFRDLPAAAQLLQSSELHDGCFVPRRSHFTGDVHVHDLAWIGGSQKSEPELWFVNTAFSALCTRSERYSFELRWQPRFVSKSLPEDRCHLNGLGVRDGIVCWATALGETDEPQGWRTNKRDGGILVDVTTNEVIGRGLSMPHSPRWHDGRLWILESGTGGIGVIDLGSGRYEEVARLPGFTRGLAFCGPLAFVGLSQVRDTAMFGGIPLVESLPERNCGVWALDTRTGQIVAFVRFVNAVQEVFAVEVLPYRFPELINDDPEILAGCFDLT
jgi:uncharacterized protein (TIGR03032 family)